jgi:hypothetical protein
MFWATKKLLSRRTHCCASGWPIGRTTPAPPGIWPRAGCFPVHLIGSCRIGPRPASPIFSRALQPQLLTSIVCLRSINLVQGDSDFFGAQATSRAYPRRNDGTGRYLPTKSGRAIISYWPIAWIGWMPAYARAHPLRSARTIPALEFFASVWACRERQCPRMIDLKLGHCRRHGGSNTDVSLINRCRIRKVELNSHHHLRVFNTFLTV